MKRFPIIRPFATILAIAAVALVASISAVQADVGFALQIKPLLHTIVDYAFAGILAFALWTSTVILSRFSKKIGVDIDEKTRAYLDIAIINGVSYAERKVSDLVEDMSEPHIESAVVAETANYVLARVPDALNHFGITSEDLTDLIQARLNQVAIASD